MTSIHHETRVAKILEAHPGAKRSGFRAEMAKVYDEEEPAPTECLGSCESEPCACEGDWRETRAEWLDMFRFRPDAWEITEGEHGWDVTCWEVHVYGNPEEKMSRYIEAFWALDAIGPYYLRLVHVDAFGREAELDLLDEWGTRLRLTR